MKTRLLMVGLATIFMAGFVHAQAKASEVQIKLEKERYALYETVNGTVANLAPGENCTVGLSDAFGRALATQSVRRAGVKPTPFSFRIDFAPTMSCTVNVVTSTGRKTSIPLVVASPQPMWDEFPIMIWEDVSTCDAGYFSSARLLGFDADFTGAKNKPEGLLHNDFRNMANDVIGAGAFNAVPPVEAAPAGPGKAKGVAGPIRNPSLADPMIVAGWEKTIDSVIDAQKDYFPAGFSLGDRLSLGRGTDAVDFSFDERTLADFRLWLQTRYPSLGALNNVWGTKFSKWSDVVPMTAQETIASQFGKTPRGRKGRNFASWFAHRVFMDAQFSRTLTTLAGHAHDTGRAKQAEAWIGMTGTFEPAAYGGYDWSQLVEVFDWFEGPDALDSKALVNALNRRRRAPAITLTALGDHAKPDEISRALWKGVFLGDRGVVVHTGMGFISREGQASDLAFALGWQLRILRDGMGRLFANPEMGSAHDGIALYYSQDSIRVQWMLDAGRDPRVLGRSITDADSCELASRLGWMEVLDDLHLGYTFIGSRNLLGDPKALQDVSVLILPRTVCMSKEEVLRLNAWVRAGGTLVADSQTALFDENGVGLEQGQLDTLFGVGRTDTGSVETTGNFASIVKMPIRMQNTGTAKPITLGVTTAGLYPVESSVRATSAKALLESGQIQSVFMRKLGEGNAIYLNLSMIAYHRDRYEPAKVVGLRRLVGQLLTYMKATPAASIRALKDSTLQPDDVAVYRCTLAPYDIVALMRRPAAQPAPMPAPPAVAEPAAPAAEPAPEANPEEAPADEPAPIAKPEEAPPAAPAEAAPEVPAQEIVPENVPEAPAAPEEKEKPQTPAAKEAAPEPKKETEEAKPAVQSVKLILAKKCHAYDMIRREYLGNNTRFDVPVPDDAPALIACLPYQVRAVKANLKLVGRQLNYNFSLETEPGVRVGTHVFHVEFSDPKDKVSYIHSLNPTGRGGVASGTMNFALGDAAGTWTLTITDVVSGVSTTSTVELK